MHIVGTVANTELIFAAELMIQLCQHIRVVHRVGIQAGVDSRTLISGGIQAVVDGGDVGRCNGDQTTLVQLTLFKISEEKRTVFFDGATQTGAILSLRRRQFCIGQRVGGVETLIAKVSIKIAIECIGAALGHHVDVATECASKLRLSARCYYLEFIDYIQPVEDAAEPGSVVIGGQTIHNETVR